MQQGYYFTLLVVSVLFTVLMFGPKASAEEENVCSDDIAKFCTDVKIGQRTILECLKKHETELSDACKNYEANMVRIEKREEIWALVKLRQTCRDDLMQYCKDIKLGSGGIAACLNEHESKLSDSCREALQATKAEKKK